MNYGIQLYGGMPHFNADPAGFMRMLADFGYAELEPCILLDGEPLPFTWTLDQLVEYAAMARKLGLGFDSCHVFAPEFWRCVPQMKQAAQVAGFRHFVVGCPGAFDRETLDAFARHCMDTAGVLAESGLALWLHNGPNEIAAQIDGVSAYEYILRACGGKLGAQVDTGWTVCGGLDLATFFARSGEYVRSVHHKDVAALPDENGNVVNVGIGSGIVDTALAHAFGREHGLGQLVDQDSSPVSLIDDMRTSLEFLKALD